MWFKQKQKNRRLHRGHVLDVKLRSDQVRAKRTRVATVFTTVILGTVFGLYLFWRTGEWALNKFVYENADFAVQKIDVQTDGVISTDQLRRWADVKTGANLIALNLQAVKRNLELVPAINTVSIERILPHTLKIRVTERKSIAQVNVARADAKNGIVVSVLEFDKDGFVMQRIDPRFTTIQFSQINPQLPVITGLNVYQLQPGVRVDSTQVQAALKLISALKNSPMATLADLRSIDVSAPGVIVATTGRGGQITFPLDDPERQLKRWRQIYDYAASKNQMIITLDLAVENNVPLHTAEINSQPAVAPVPRGGSTPANSRRKNV